MTTTKHRTAPFEALRREAATANTGEPHIRRQVAIPGLENNGKPVYVEATWHIDEVAEDWVSVVQNFDYDAGPVVYGNHPAAVGTLHDLLPGEYPRREWPSGGSIRVARDMLVSMLVKLQAGGIVIGSVSSTVLYVKPPQWVTTSIAKATYLAMIREYCPFKARMHWGAEDIVIRPALEN